MWSDAWWCGRWWPNFACRLPHCYTKTRTGKSKSFLHFWARCYSIFTRCCAHFCLHSCSNLFLSNRFAQTRWSTLCHNWDRFHSDTCKLTNAQATATADSQTDRLSEWDRESTELWPVGREFLSIVTAVSMASRWTCRSNERESGAQTAFCGQFVLFWRTVPKEQS